ncbi:hypothetical protein BLI708_04325 [Bifidobacterium imperatoris]|uniref:Transposase n=1 Tax=Bifidobacterium imperatoris TaxID=2020965 RepID=A0A2N5ITT1_9BIFI|nr:hypothetical protein [Bifidobacterium imperatoris]PLS25337.1 hypothetical protein Tam1G_0539 [Bifidobacterium imperatoris]QSY58912.1 hypothetical protein BLI708_04325 [Bifidobacterium imperatoris]
MADPRHPRRFTEEFKRQIVQLCENGKPPVEIERTGSDTRHMAHSHPIATTP